MLCHGLCLVLLFLVLSSTTFETNAQSQLQGSRDNTQVYSGVVYGPIDQNDTLWRIASRYKQDARFTVYQTMMAIYELNPQAFENGNFNTMVNGATLQLPSDRYIARIDPQRARAKADIDDRALGRKPGSNNSTNNTKQKNGKTESSPATANLKPEIPLVNQDDLSKTSTQLQRQLNSLKNQQQQQFQLLKDQVAASITSVETLLQENKQLNDQLVKIDENNRNLTQKVETELQTQIDAQVEQLSQLIALVKDAEQRRIDEESQSIMQLLSTPMALIIIMSSITLLLILGLAIFLLRKPVPVVSVVQAETVSTNIIDDDLVIGEVDDDLDQDSEDLMAALSEDDDLEEDDILSDALEDDESIDMLSEEDMEDELEGLDDMLVPDSATSVPNSDDSLGDELDLENDAISLDDEEDISLDEDDISLDDEDISLDLDDMSLNEEDISLDVDDISLDEDDISLDEENISLDEEDISLDEEDISLNEEDISLDEDESSVSNTAVAPDEVKSQSVDDDTNGAPSGISLDKNGDIDENTIEQIGNQIEEKDQTISRMTDELLVELDKVPSDSANIDELVVDEEADVPTDDVSDLSEEALTNDSEESIEDLSTLIEDEEEDITNDDELEALLDSIEGDSLDTNLEDNDQVSDLTEELLNELESKDSQTNELDQLVEEMDDNKSEDNPDTIESDELNSKTIISKPLLDADDLLDDIPSFTSDLSEEEDGLQSEIEEKPLEEVSFEENKPDTSAHKGDSKINNLSDLEEESDEDMLSGLPDLDNWLDEEDEAQLKEISKNAENDDLDLSALELDIDDLDALSNSNSDEDDLIKSLDDADFDDMLNDLADDSDKFKTTDVKITEQESSKEHSTSNSPLTNKDKELDLDALMTAEDSVVDDSAATEENDFVDVDDLLKESDAMASLSDEDVELNLDGSLDKLMPKQKEGASMSNNDSDIETNQASNLDLAQVYIDMEDFVAAKELLEEVSRLGTKEQKDEAKLLFTKLN